MDQPPRPDDDLPPELRALENDLAARPGPDAGGTVRARVLGAVHQELSAGSRRKPVSLWWLAAAAAALLLWLNLSISAVNNTDTGLSDKSNGWNARAAQAQILAVVPECSEEDARGLALLLRARAHLVTVPQPTGQVADAAGL